MAIPQMQQLLCLQTYLQGQIEDIHHGVCGLVKNVDDGLLPGPHDAQPQLLVTDDLGRKILQS